MNKKEPCRDVLLSIIIPVYNVQDYLPDCLDSVIGQDFPSLEIICVDDCSTDESLNVLRRYASRDVRIKVVELNKNGGQANARNIGVKRACGKYICYLDSDDMLAEGCLKRLLPYIDDDLEMLTYEIAWVKFDVRPQNVPDDMYQLRYDYSGLGVTSGRSFFAEMVERNEFYYNVVFALYRRTWLQSTGIRFREGMIHEDGPYILACYLQCEKMRHVRVGVYIRRYRANSTMTADNKFNFSRMCGLLWGYEESLRLYYQMNGMKQRERECLLRLILNNMEVARYHALRLPLAETLHFQNLKGIPQLLSVGLLAHANNFWLLLDGLRIRIMEAEQVYLYGSGKIGLRTISYLRLVGLEKKVQGFIETEHVLDEHRHGKPVFFIRDIVPKEGTLLVLSASLKYQADMLQAAEQQGFSNILSVDLLLNQLMQQVIDGESEALA